MLAPALAIVLLLFVGGLAFGFLQSLGYLPLIGRTTLSADAYARTLSDTAFTRAVGLSLWIAFGATAISTVLAIATALLIRGTRRGRRALTFIYQLNLPIPHIVGAVAMLFLLSQSGLLSRITHALGLTSEPADFPPLVRDPWGAGIIAEYVWKEVPFIGVVVLAALSAGVEEYEDLARTLGASRWQRFRYVVLPLITPAVLSTSIIVFAFSFGAFEVPFLLGQPFPAALPVLAYRAYIDVNLASRSEAMAINMIIASVVVVLVFIYMALTRRYLRASR